MKRQASVPECHHIRERSETIANRKQLAFIGRQLLVRQKNLLLFVYVDWFNPDAGRTHQKPCPFLPQAGIQVHCVARLVRPFSCSANRVCLLPV